MHRLSLRLALAGALAISLPSAGAAEDRLLDEAVGFAGTIGFLQAGTPAFVIAAVRGGETGFAGFGEIADGSGKAPDADTIMRVGSISKAFCGATLAGMVADGEIGLTDLLQDRLGYDVTVPEMGGRPIRIIDLVTHSAGLPREVPRPDAPADDPFATNDRETQIASLKSDPLLYPPGTAALYSNFGFDLLGAALANVGGKPYAELLGERFLAPLGMKDTVFNPAPADQGRLMQGHDFDGKPMPWVPTPLSIECAGGLHTTANDMLAWMKWHLDRFSPDDAEARRLDHAPWLYRDGLASAVGFDDGGEMDAIGLAWIVMMPEGDRPLILQKSGGLQGMFAYVAIAPTRDIGVFAAINEFSVGGFAAMVATVTSLITDLAPR
jgi:D-alanyl-D-alanine-carboxypeptidase/D-alanyl-D-alanine-endopeptidase